jgi:alanine racemase
MRSNHVQVTVDLDRIRASAEEIRSRTGVALIAVIKADAYGMGAERVADALVSTVDAFAYFSIDAAAHRELGLLPTVASRADAMRLRGTPLLLSVDTGMQRFGCAAEEATDILKRGDFRQAFTHAAGPDGAAQLADCCGGRVEMLHAAATSLLDHAPSRLDAVRPGLALYRGALSVTTELAVAHDTSGPIGYTRFVAPRVGVVLAGYSNGLRPGPALVNGRRQRLLEVGMNTSFVSIEAEDRQGDPVVLLGGELAEAELADHFGTREHEILCRYAAMGPREYRYAGDAVGRRVA